MADRARLYADLTATDALINRVREARGLRPFDQEDAHQFYAGWNAAIADVDDFLVAEREHAAAQLSTGFRARFPALVRWRDRMLKSTKRGKPADVAAAYELLALECTLAGEDTLAAKAVDSARRVIAAAVARRSVSSNATKQGATNAA